MKCDFSTRSLVATQNKVKVRLQIAYSDLRGIFSFTLLGGGN